MAVFTFVSVMPPLLLRYLMDEVVKPELWNRLVGTMILIFVVPITAEVLRFVNMRLVIYTSRRFIADLRLAMYRK